MQEHRVSLIKRIIYKLFCHNYVKLFAIGDSTDSFIIRKGRIMRGVRWKEKCKICAHEREVDYL